MLPWWNGRALTPENSIQPGGNAVLQYHFQLLYPLGTHGTMRRDGLNQGQQATPPPGMMMWQYDNYTRPELCLRTVTSRQVV